MSHFNVRAFLKELHNAYNGGIPKEAQPEQEETMGEEIRIQEERQRRAMKEASLVRLQYLVNQREQVEANISALCEELGLDPPAPTTVARPMPKGLQNQPDMEGRLLPGTVCRVKKDA
jgi:hypothetical protein